MRRLAATLAAVALATACSSGDEPERGLDAMGTPSFEPGDPTSSTAPVAVEGGPATSSPTTAAPGEASAETTTTLVIIGGTEAVPEREVVSFDDPVGDAVGGLDDDPPAWSDLAGGSLERQGDAYRLTVRLGDQAPETQPGAETMNVATFFDVDGDGAVDHELWVNLGDAGWGVTRWEGDTAYPRDASGATVEVVGSELTLEFDATTIGSPAALRFSIASEYGAVEVIGSEFARRDDAPDDDQAVSFP